LQKMADLLACLRELAPEELAEPWDNCGLLVGTGREHAERIVVCLDVTREVVDEAVAKKADLIICHHPLIFRPLKRVTDESAAGSHIIKLIQNDISVYAAHTNVDKTYGGLNDLLAGIISLETEVAGSGNKVAGGGNEALACYRIGTLPNAQRVGEFIEYVRKRLKLASLNVNYPPAEAKGNGRRNPNGEKLIEKVVVMCGALDIGADKLLSLGADAVVCGEIRHHEILDLSASDILVIQAGHHGTERFFMSLVEKWIKEQYPDIEIFRHGFSEPPTLVYNGSILPYNI